VKRIGWNLVALVITTAHACGGLTIEDPAGNDVSSDCTVNWVGGEAYISINSRVPGNVIIFRSDSGQSIARIDSLAISDGNSGTQVVIRVLSDRGSGVNNLGRIYQAGSEIVIVNEVLVHGTIGSIECDAIGNVTADGTIYGPIVSTGDHFTPGVTAVKSNNGNILGEISVASYPGTTLDRIGWVSAPNGTVGQSANVRASLSAASYIQSVVARQIYADITQPRN